MSWYYDFRPYVPVAKRRANAAAFAAKLAKKEKRSLVPIKIEGRKIAKSFWGNSWCDNLEDHSDFANRLPRGRSYVRNGSVIDLQIARGKIKAIVAGSEVYEVTIDIKTLPAAAWSRIKQDCARSIDSLIDLLQGRFDQGIMQRLTQRDGGLLPQPKEIGMRCSCPDYATMCKHVAAVLYGVGARLDAAPELLFALRDVDHLELISQAVAADNLDQALQGRPETSLAGSDLGEIFGIDLEADAAPTGRAAKPARAAKTPRTKKPALHVDTARLMSAPVKRAAKAASKKTPAPARKRPRATATAK